MASATAGRVPRALTHQQRRVRRMRVRVGTAPHTCNAPMVQSSSRRLLLCALAVTRVDYDVVCDRIPLHKMLGPGPRHDGVRVPALIVLDDLAVGPRPIGPRHLLREASRGYYATARLGVQRRAAARSGEARRGAARSERRRCARAQMAKRDSAEQLACTSWPT